jgi:hypothetical protein
MKSTTIYKKWGFATIDNSIIKKILGSLPERDIADYKRELLAFFAK